MTNSLSKNIIFIIIMLLLTAVVVFNPSYAAPAANGTASGLGNIDSVLGNIVAMLTGGTARLIAIICVVFVGIGWMYGFIDLRKAAYCILGIAIVFGAPTLVSKLMGTST
ncbi:TrbC/VirB2 family protein [Bartonella rattaustraliani]|uniref:TrbC/VirB2 family protein n=1 Tax=Bartonella rattaustraliani TaxID=481139 RepID=UPI000365AE79|nr:TrbC/VirB2 family protein [Bartonella rattaustraliani]